MTRELVHQQPALRSNCSERLDDFATKEFVLDSGNLDALQSQMNILGWLASERIVSAERIGNGNMNMTIRIRTARSSFILKQARPWVVKYPQIPAPIERAVVEAGFYSVAAGIPYIASRMPQLLGFDSCSSLLWLEDMGEMGDLMCAYHTGETSPMQCFELTEFLSQLHAAAIPSWASVLLKNRAMRKLNHEHQYDLPLRAENGIDLEKITAGLSGLADELKNDQDYCARITELGNRYLSDGDSLVHGDFFPGSWLATQRGLAVIDPEFCHLGSREYDLGVFLAHLEFMKSRQLWTTVVEHYSGAVDWTLARRYAGAEIMRRLIGVAQLPLTADLASKRAWLALSRELVCAE